MGESAVCPCPLGARGFSPPRKLTGATPFTTSSASSPAGINWTQVLYQDTSRSGKIASGDPIIAGPINVVAGQEICLLLKQIARANAPAGAINKVTVTAGFTYTNAKPSPPRRAQI
jgi:hypothetical protein